MLSGWYWLIWGVISLINGGIFVASWLMLNGTQRLLEGCRETLAESERIQADVEAALR